jgi:glycosyltransferase involved in cell wall biosynthesis
VLEEIPGVKFIFAGASHPTLPTEELDELINTNGLSGKVERLGQVGRDRLGTLYRAASVCVLPSYYESFGLAALEAMSFEVAVVATRVGGLPEVVDDGITGLLVKPGDASALAKALLALLTDPERRGRMGKLGRERAELLFSADRIFDMNLAIYQQAIGTHP